MQRWVYRPSPSASSFGVARSDTRYDTMFHRCSGVNPAAYPVIGVPEIPTDTIRYIVAGDTPLIVGAAPIAGGAGRMPRDAAPLPRPDTPWHDAQVRSYRWSP